jgi:hypothetical protein
VQSDIIYKRSYFHKDVVVVTRDKLVPVFTILKSNLRSWFSVCPTARGVNYSLELRSYSSFSYGQDADTANHVEISIMEKWHLCIVFMGTTRGVSLLSVSSFGTGFLLYANHFGNHVHAT